MNTLKFFNKTDLYEIQDIIQKLKDKKGIADFITFEYLLENWERIVACVVIGYGFTIWDYTNDLSTRSILQKIIDRVSPAVGKKINSVIQDIDREFLEATEQIPEPLENIPNPPTEIERMLYFRKPKNVGKEFKESLEKMGL